MGFFSKLFKKKTVKEEPEVSSWDRLLEEKSSLNMKDPVVREQFVLNCLEQMREASAELDRINNEYAIVTGYLTDMEDLENFPEDTRKELESIAFHMQKLKESHDAFVMRPSLMTEEEFNRMERVAATAEDGIEKLTKEEEYREKVRHDMARIDKERNAYEYRRHEVVSSIENSRGIATISMVSAVLLVIILFALQIFLKFDVTIGYYITIVCVAIAMTVIYVRYTERVSEKRTIDNTINELILLENKVKIRYVNSTNLLDYLYVKYDVATAAELADLYEKYKKERVVRREFLRNQAAYDDETERFVEILRKNRLKYPDIWVHQAEAIIDHREMVEIRHKLIGRRQKLRKQLEYNEQIALEAGDEVKSIIRDYPEYADSILKLVNRYES